MQHSVSTRDAVWRPGLGAYPDAGGVRFRVWAPRRRQVDLVIDPARMVSRRPLAIDAGGFWSTTLDDVPAGMQYAYLLDGEGPYPDPASRFQPEGVHGPSMVVDPHAFRWSDADWRGVPLERAVIYELHVGTFTAEGTFAGAMARLPYLADLGVTVVELMPVADFAGSRNWGYDGVNLFAPSRSYGTPDDLRRVVDTAHRHGLAVMLDVVYNHFGPDGAYHALFSPFYLSSRHRSPWGPAVNLDGEHSGPVRAFFVENALHWLHEYHVDGLRLDATHALADDSPRHFLAELAEQVRRSVTGREVLLITEDERNLVTIVRPTADGGWGLDAVWADDFHHQVRVMTAGDRDGYYADYSRSIADLAATLRQGWFYCGQWSAYAGRPRGTDPAGVPLERMVICIQNHDQIGNRPFGRRLHHQIDARSYRAVSALLLFAPETLLLFMGQEWAASSRFCYFTDHHPELGRLVTEGRRAEFARFEAFADEAQRARIPDPQAASTFEMSRLRWEEQAQPEHAGILDLYRALLRLRRREPALAPGSRLEVVGLDDFGLAVARTPAAGDALLLVACLKGSGTYELARSGPSMPGARWELVLSADDAAPEIDLRDMLVVRFSGPSAVILSRV
ncbi:MAG: malto-oligosyltrehalose trehalohydrolase [Acidobacteria bacterium]|nr:malto-oligosyltrehalose trehalohydrolase [Acidobacteriota bacterium]